MKSNLKIITFLCITGVTFGCKEKVNPESPSITTGDVFTITGRGTVVNGTIVSEGGYRITEAGILYGTSSNLTIADEKEKIDMANIKGYPHEFSVLLRGASNSTNVRSYVIADGKAFYGNTKSVQ